MSLSCLGRLLGGGLRRIFLAFLNRVCRVRSAGHRCRLVLFWLTHIHFVVVLPFVTVGIDDAVGVALAVLII